jgi:hypothetical protein
MVSFYGGSREKRVREKDIQGIIDGNSLCLYGNSIGGEDY